LEGGKGLSFGEGRRNITRLVGVGGKELNGRKFRGKRREKNQKGD